MSKINSILSVTTKVAADGTEYVLTVAQLDDGCVVSGVGGHFKAGDIVETWHDGRFNKNKMQKNRTKVLDNKDVVK